MKTFAYIHNGLALDPVRAANIEAARKMFSAAIVTAWSMQGRILQEVPDGTRHGATFVEGEISNPEIPAPEIRYLDLTQVQFMDHSAAMLGEGISGPIRFDQIFAAARASNDPGVPFAIGQYDMAEELVRDKVAGFLDLFVDYGIGGFTTDERDAIINNWPSA